MLINQRSEAAAFAYNDALEAQFLPQHVIHPLLGSVRRHIFDLRISGHHSQSAGFGDSANPRKQDVLANVTI